MIDLYTWTTPNGRKASIMLEEIGLPYKAHPIDISKDEQFAPAFLKIAPNNRIPAIIDPDGHAIAFYQSLDKDDDWVAAQTQFHKLQPR